MSRTDVSTKRLRKGMATIVKGTQAAKVPMEVPATSLVKGMMATMRIIKGTERMMLTIVPKTRLIGAFSGIIATVIGIPLGILLVTTDKGHILENAPIIPSRT